MEVADSSLFEGAVDAVPELVVFFTPEGKMVEWNRRVPEETGYANEEIATMHPVDFVCSEEGDLIREHIRKVVTNGRTRVNVRLRTKQGDLRPYDFTGTLVEKNNQDLVCAVGRNAADQKSGGYGLTDPDETFRKVAEETPVGIALLQDGTHEYVNPSLVRMTGYSRETLFHRSPGVYVHSHDWPEVRKQIDGLLTGDVERICTEVRIETESGVTRVLEVGANRIDYRGRPAVIAVAHDVTEKKRLQREILQVQEIERKHLGQELHDGLASQLTGASMMLARAKELADRQCADLSSRVDQVWKIIRETAEGVRRLSHGLNPAGLRDGELVLALESLAEIADEIRLEIDRSVEAGEPSSLDQETLTHVYRIAQEAVNNARRHSEADDIVVRLRRAGDVGVLEIEDDGVGFDRAALEKESSLGLRSMQHRADAIGGSLSIKSDSGGGALVRCRFPVEVES